jgi:prepilin-type N-terminal cleavage/methylation domain-containing protein
MKLPKLWSLRENQKGFTLIEVLAVLAITGIMGLGVAMATSQVVNQGGRNSDYTTASRHTLNAIHWVGRDIQMSQTIEPDGVWGFPLTLSWVEWDNSSHQVTYSISAEDKLMRSYSGNGSMETVVAEYINADSGNTACAFISDNVVMVKVTTTVGDGSNAVSITKVREIAPRPGF